MIISPPFLPAEGLTMPAEKWKTDPMMDKVDEFELSHSGVFPVAFDRRWHPGMHLVPYGGLGQKEPVRAIADGEVVAYRVAKKAITDGAKKADGTDDLNSNTGFVLLKHTTDTGEGRTITFYSLYMHLLDLVSTNALVPQPNSPAPESSPNALPAWLLTDSGGVQKGSGKKVYRKDRLGYRGISQGEAHLHFEIFMTERDFTTYFEQAEHRVPIGSRQYDTPNSKDYWGRTYYVVPAGSNFLSVPPGLANVRTAGRTPKPYFPPLDADTLANSATLYVEAYFSRGERFMRAWLDSGDGKLVSITAEPVQDKFAEYEYTLYERATKFYEPCPSEGYELLRFGRILSSGTRKLASDKCATWVAVPFASGKMGYIDVNQSSIKKLSDADFPFFMDWQKIEAGNTPFDESGMCGYDELCKVTGVNDSGSSSHGVMPAELSREQQLATYVRSKAEVRAKLRGFICHAKSEWDAGNNEDRYKGLKEANGFFASNLQGYEKFIAFREKFQFMKETPLGEGGKFWFFHPLAFIRHFRKCGWLGAKAIEHLIPKHAWLSQSGELLTPLAKSLTSEELKGRIGPHLNALNATIRKYLLNASSERLALFLAQTYIETDRWKTFREYGKGASNPGIPMAQYYAAFYGRGIMQLTWASAYEKYGEFKRLPEIEGSYDGESRITQTSLHYWDDPTKRDSHSHIIGVVGVPEKWGPRYNPDSIASDSLLACDSGGFFWVWKHHTGTRNINRIADRGFSEITIDKVNKLVNGGSFGYFERFVFSFYARNIVTDWLPGTDDLIVTTPRHKRVKVDLSKPS